MKRSQVTSSNIRSVGYDGINEVLEVEFHHGKVYHYKDVPANLVKDLLDASSVGKFFNTNVKNVYKFEQGEFKEPIVVPTFNIYICGPAGAGKTYTAKYLIQKFKFLGAKVAFPVYGLAYDYFHMDKKDRKLLQTIGTEGARDVVDSDIWVNRFIEDIKIVETTRKLLDLPKVGFVCDDCRFENEHKTLKENGWIGLYLNVSDEIRLERLKKEGWRCTSWHTYTFIRIRYG